MWLCSQLGCLGKILDMLHACLIAHGDAQLVLVFSCLSHVLPREALLPSPGNAHQASVFVMPQHQLHFLSTHSPCLVLSQTDKQHRWNLLLNHHFCGCLLPTLQRYAIQQMHPSTNRTPPKARTYPWAESDHQPILMS